MAKKKNENNDQLEARVADLEAQLKRAVADYHNLERRISEGRSELSSWASAELIKNILPVLDHLEQALVGVKESNPSAHSNDSGQASSGQGESEGISGWVRGVELAVKELKDVLAREGLDEIPADGVFDPALHEAVDTREGDDNMILEVVRKGYTLNGKVLRPAHVVVGRSHSASDEASRDKEDESDESTEGVVSS